MPRRICPPDPPTIPRVEIAEISAAGGIAHFNRVIQIVALDDSAALVPSAAEPAADARRLRS
jgi:hypothetical protein